MVINFSRQGKHREFNHNTGKFDNREKVDQFYVSSLGLELW